MTELVLCSKDDVKQFSQASSTWTGFDTQIDRHISIASNMIKTFCRRTFERNTYTEFFMSPSDNSSGGPFRVHLIEPPVLANSLTIAYDPTGRFITDVSYITSLVENTDYLVDYTKGTVGFMGCFEYSPRGFRITYTGGYDVGTGGSASILQVESSLANNCAKQVAFMLGQSIAGQTGVQEMERGRVTSQKFTVSATSGLLAEVEAGIMGYRRALVGRR